MQKNVPDKTYSVKYLGIVNDKIGILSKRVSMVKEFTNPLLKALPIRTTDSHMTKKVEVKEKVIKSSVETKRVEQRVEKRIIDKEEEKEMEKEENEGEDVQCVPITTKSINAMFKDSNYLKEHFEPDVDEAEELPNIQSNENSIKDCIVKKESVIPDKEEQIAVERVKVINLINPKITSRKKSYSVKDEIETLNEGSIVPRYSMQPQSTAQTLLPGIESSRRCSEESNKELYPYPEKYNQPLVHNYFFPKALPVYKKSKKRIKQPQFLETVNMNIKNRTGFKGTKFYFNEVQKIKQSLAKLKQGPLINEESASSRAKKDPLSKNENKNEDNSFKEILRNLNTQVTSFNDCLFENNSLINKILKEGNKNEEILEEAEDLEVSISKPEEQNPQVNSLNIL